jgi:hypothetical protein
MFISELFLDEISDEALQRYLQGAGKNVDRRMDRMARVRDRLNKGYEIYHADRPANGKAIVDRFEADTPALARQYYEKFITDYESDRDFDLQLRRSTGIMEGLSQNQAQVRQTLNAWMDQDQQYEDPTQRAGFQAKVWPYIQKNIQSILSDKGADGKGSYPAAPYAAWLLVQHMDAYPQNQASFLSALEQSGLDPTDGDGKNIGKLQFLRDRLAVNKWIAANANNKEYYVNGKPLPNPTVNVRNPAMFKDAGIVATSRKDALDNAVKYGNKLLVAAVQATDAQTQPSFKQGVNETVNPMRQQAGKMIDKYFGQIYSYGDSGLDYLDNHAPIWFKLSDQFGGDIDVIIATAPVNLLAKSAQELKNVASDLGYELDEASGTPQYVTRIDSTDIKDFSSNMPTYYHTKDWSQSGQFKPGSKIPKKFSSKVKGTFAGNPHRTALYATGNAGETRFVEITDLDDQSYVYFDKKDLSKIRSRKSYLTVFSADNFKITNTNTGEYFSSNPGKPVKQEQITDPFQYITSQGWIVRISDDLTKVLAHAKQLHKQNKIKSYGGEGMGFQENLNEITAVPTVTKSKRQHLDVMPNDGKPIPNGEEAEYLGKFISKMPSGHELWGWDSRWDRTYFVYDPETRISQLATTGKQYPENPNSFVVVGLYSGPKNQVRAADLYAFLILNQGITLVSDNKQSEGGYRVWQELERRYGKTINVHGFDTRTNTGVNVTTRDEPDTHVDRDTVKRAGPQMKRELGSVSRDLRFVASAR